MHSPQGGRTRILAMDAHAAMSTRTAMRGAFSKNQYHHQQQQQDHINIIMFENPEDMVEYFERAIMTPTNFGQGFQDLASSKDCTTMYVIETDDNPRDFTAAPKIYGAYWAETPDPVNQIAINLWPEFGSPRFRDEEDNVHGQDTQEGNCYISSACLGVGQKFLSMSVRRIHHTAEFRNLRTGLVKQILSSRGLPTEGDKTDMIKRAEEAKIVR